MTNRMNKRIRILKKTILGVASLLFLSCGTPASVRDGAGAKSDLPELSAEDQRRYDYFFLEATRLSVKGEYDSAFDLYKHCLEINPEAPSALYEIAQLYLYLNLAPMAEAALEKAVANSPENYWYKQALVGLYQERQKTDEAIRLLEKMQEEFPDNRSEILANLLTMYARKGDYDNQINTLNRLENQMGKNEQVTLEKLRIYQQRKEAGKALEEIESLVKEYPLDLRYQTYLGDTYLQNGLPEKARETLQKVLDEDPDNSFGLLSMANYYEKTGQMEEYDKQIDRMLFNKNIPGEMKIHIMQYLILKGEEQKMDSTFVISRFERIIEQDTEDTQVPMLYVQYLISKQMEEEANPVLEHILQLEPENTMARMTLLASAIRKNDSAWVIRITEPGVDVTPEVLDFYYYLGMAYYQEERIDEALQTYKKGLQNMPENTRAEIISEFYGIMGDIYYQKKQMQDMYLAYDSALVYNPDNIGALNNYAYYLSLEKKDLDKAEEMSHKTIKAEPDNSTYLDTYAWVFFVKGNYAQARIYIDNALKNGGEESADILEHAGDIYYMTGDVEKALHYWNKALEQGSESKILGEKIKRKKYIPDAKK